MSFGFVHARYVVALLCCLGLAGCGGDAPPASDAHSPAATADVASNISVSSGAPAPHQAAVQPYAPASPAAAPIADPAPARVAARPAVNVGNSAPAAPEGAQWTIYCDTVRGPAHVEESDRLKAQLISTTGMRGWYLLHHSTESVLFYGYYGDVEDKDARADKHRIDALAGASKGEKRFASSQFVPISSPDPDSPPQWNLENAPSDRFWSLQVAAYRATPDRKKLAVDSVREARKEGIEAYYYHGDSISSVCIGSWKSNAVAQQGDDAAARTTNADQPLMVIPQIPSNIDPSRFKGLKNSEGKDMVVMAPKLEIVDRSLKQAMSQYPTHHINGYEDVQKDRAGHLIKTPSFLVQIPNREGLLLVQDAPAERPAGDQLISPAGPDAPTADQLEHDLDRPSNLGTKLPAGPAAPARSLKTPATAPAVDEDPTLGKLRVLGEQ